MRSAPIRTLRLITIAIAAYIAVCLTAGIFAAEGALHPARRSLGPEDRRLVEQATHGLAILEDTNITAADGAVLRGWSLRPGNPNHDAVILLHGLSDNRLGMMGYAEVLLGGGYTVLMPDARAHGASGGELATYGLLEREDIRRWFNWLAAHEHPRCIFGLGESMGAAQLLQSLPTEPNFCAVVAESSFSSFREIAFDRVGQFFHAGPWLGRVPLRPLVETAFLYARWKYALDMTAVSPEDAVARIQVPVFLIHGQVDGNIPVRHSRRIQARQSQVVLWEVPSADHCGALSSAHEEFASRLDGWMRGHDRPGSVLRRQ